MLKKAFLINTLKEFFGSARQRQTGDPDRFRKTQRDKGLANFKTAQLPVSGLILGACRTWIAAD